MATLLRPPLVFDRRQKRPVGYADVPPNLIESTLNATVLSLLPPLTAEQLDDSAPRLKRQARVDQTPNLLCSTLFATTQKSLPLGPEQWDDSSPQRVRRVSIDVYQNLLATTLGTPAATLTLPMMAEQVDDASTRLKRAVYADQAANLLPLAPVPLVLQLDQSAQPRKVQVQLDVFPNLSGTTLQQFAALDLPLNAVRLDTPAPWVRAPVYDWTRPDLTIQISLVAVPNVVTETQAQATTDIQAVGLVVVVTSDYSDTVAVGTVISQAPTAGSLALVGDSVTIVVSLGPQPASTTRGAGRIRRQRRRYTIRIEGQIFEADSEAEAVAILAQAQSLAEVAATKRADVIVEKAIPRVVSLGAVRPIAIKAPTLDVSPELQAQAEAAQQAIDKAYASASAIAELRLLLALMEAEDEEEFLLLH